MRVRILSLSLSSIALQTATNTNVVVRRENSKKNLEEETRMRERGEKRKKKKRRRRRRRKARISTTSLFFLPYVYVWVDNLEVNGVIERANRQHSVLYFRITRLFFEREEGEERKTKSNSSRHISQCETQLLHLTYSSVNGIFNLFIKWMQW